MSTHSATDVLVVAPNGSAVANLATKLPTEELSVTHARGVDVACQQIETTSVDCVVLGHTEGEFDGFGCLEKLRKSTPKLPVVLVPSTVTDSVASQAVAANVDALIPATDADLAESVTAEIDTHVDTDGVQLPISVLPAPARRRLKERALDEAPIGITIADATATDLPTIYINESFKDVTGYTPAEAVGRNLRFLQGPETDAQQVRKLREGIEADRDTRVVLRNYRQDGTPYWSQVHISPLYDDAGAVTHYVGFQLDVTDRKRAEQQLQAERELLDRLLDRIQGVLNDTTEILVQATNREELEAKITDRLSDEYVSAWLGRYAGAEGRLTITQHAGDHELRSSPNRAVDIADDEQLRACIDANAVYTADKLSLLELGDDEHCVLVPLSYRSTVYGLIGIVCRTDWFDDREQVLLGSIGRSVGASINSQLTKRTLTTDSMLTVGVELFDEELLFSQLAAAVGTTFNYEAVLTADRQAGVTLLMSTPCDLEELSNAAMDFESVRAVDPIVAGEMSVVQFKLVDSTLVDILSTFGGQLTTMDINDARLAVEFSVATEATAQSLLEALRTHYDRVDLVAYHEADPQQTAQGFRAEFRSRLTDRQLTAIKMAYISGYFEWPRRVDGSQLAASMDIVPSTYHQHLQAATRKLMELVFET